MKFISFFVDNLGKIYRIDLNKFDLKYILQDKIWKIDSEKS